MPKIAVLIPCYNESATVAKVVTDYKNALPEADIYVYDNNSTDGTDELAREAGAIVKYEYRQGKGNVIRSMFRQIDADCYLMIDGDDTYPAEHAREMCELVLNKGVDMVIGDRLSSTYFEQNKRPFHNAGNKAVRLLINKIFNNFWIFFSFNKFFTHKKSLTFNKEYEGNSLFMLDYSSSFLDFLPFFSAIAALAASRSAWIFSLAV